MSKFYMKWKIKENLYPLYLAFILMFGFPFNMYYEYGIAALWAYSIRSHNPYESHKSSSRTFMMVCGLIWTLSCMYSINMEFALKYMFLYFSTYFICLYTSTFSFRRMLKFLLILGGAHVFFIMVDFFNHDFVMSIASKILSREQIEINNNLRLYSGACAGLTGQTGQAALFVTVFMYVVASFSSKNKIFIFLLVPAIIALLLTQKRSFLGFGILFSLGYILYNLKNINAWSKVIIIFSGCISFLLMQHYIELYFDISGITEKIEGGSLSNRDVLWNRMLDIFSDNKLLGVGLYSTDKILGMTGHNIYIQLLCENGVLGASVFFVMFIRSLYVTIKNRVDLDIVAFSKMIVLFVLFYGFFGNPIYEIQTLFLLFISMTILDRVKSDKANFINCNREIVCQKE